MIIIEKKHYQEILSYSLEALPNEACGLLGGDISHDIKTVKKVYLLTNVDHSPEHFSMDPKEQFNVIRDMRKNNWSLIGNFHSHPASPSRPSEEDKRLAFDPETSYLILSLQDQLNPVLKSYKIHSFQVTEEEIKLIEGSEDGDG